MEDYFRKFRENIIGIDQEFISPYGTRKIIYGDWIASGRLYRPIEESLVNRFGPYVGNTHTEASETGTLMTKAYHYAQHIIKDHVHAGPNDVIINAGSGMTTVINKLQRILGIRSMAKYAVPNAIAEEDRPVVFITHMEHHSNHTSWLETIADVVQLMPDKDLLVDLNQLRLELAKYPERKMKIGSFTACSNVTGISTPIHEMARIMHENGGLCFIDFAASAPYTKIDMHPDDPMEALDAIFFSPHKFLGGPGSSGVMVFNSSIYTCQVPDNPGGGTVDWTNPWGEFKYVDDIEAREDGGTPAFLQTIKAALSIKLKVQMGIEQMRIREEELVKIVFEEMPKIPQLHILADNIKNRLGIISFYLENVHFNLVVKLLNDRFGVQVRGGCACAGTYGHFLLDVSHDQSRQITERINFGDLSQKPGWIRLSLHPTMSNDELYLILEAIRQVQLNHQTWRNDYIYNNKTNEFKHKSEMIDKTEIVKAWFEMD
ncbi:MAG TPA: aminotransferase class V-fold PLP-dependent enzyme [Prolixibacteraceae bacterium]|nr:aminotransferase class V-fold PLP-dependent enzyme [Prolixibacteraceae bacterium]